MRTNQLNQVVNTVRAMGGKGGEKWKRGRAGRGGKFSRIETPRDGVPIPENIGGPACELLSPETSVVRAGSSASALRGGILHVILMTKSLS
jgi:hypothetical protein